MPQPSKARAALDTATCLLGSCFVPSHRDHMTVLQATNDIDLRHTWAHNGPRCGAAAIQQARQQQGIEPVPSHRTISRIFQRHTKEVNETHQRLQSGDHLRTFLVTMFRSFHPFVTVKADSIKRAEGRHVNSY